MEHPAHTNKPLAMALAAHRFGLGQVNCADVGNDAPGWLLSQLGAADAARGSGLVSSAEGVRRYAEFIRAQLAARQASAPTGTMAAGAAGVADNGMAANTTIETQFGEHFRQIVSNDVRARLSTAAQSSRPFSERLVLFWANHFTVSMSKPTVRGLVGAFEREAIRAHAHGRFEDMLGAAVRHAAMLRYLDNDISAGPDSRVVRRLAERAANPGQRPPRITGLNENLARELLELHTLGAPGAMHGGAAYGGWGAYTQADVTALAAVLTGWRVPVRQLEQDPTATEATAFEAAWHQPGSKTVLGKRYPEGPEALTQVLHDLAQHPSTARHLSYKLARHFVSDQPPPALVARLAQRYRDSDGDLTAMAQTLVLSPEAWAAQQVKLKTPEEFVLSTVRVLALGDDAFARAPDAGIRQLGQRLHAAPTPAGYSDSADDWLGPDAVWKRIEWATRVAERTGRRIDARERAQHSLGALLSSETARQIQRAADGPQAMALLLMAPEFQRR